MELVRNLMTSKGFLKSLIKTIDFLKNSKGFGKAFH